MTLCVSCQASAAGSLSPRRSLYRTLSDESVCSNRKGSSYASSRSSVLDQALPNDILFSSTPPYHSTLPPRISQPTSNLKSESIYLSNLSIRPSGCSFNQSFYRLIYLYYQFKGCTAFVSYNNCLKSAKAFLSKTIKLFEVILIFQNVLCKANNKVCHQTTRFTLLHLFVCIITIYVYHFSGQAQSSSNILNEVWMQWEIIDVFKKKNHTDPKLFEQ